MTELEIELKTGNQTLFEYYSPVSPRVGEIMALNVDEYIGCYEVTGVAHNVFRNMKSDKILTYITVYLEKAQT